MVTSPRRFIAPLLALAVTTGTLTSVAQTKSKSSSSKGRTEEKEASKYHRLPTYFGQLELKDEQVQEIYKVKDAYGPKIDKLQQQLAELKEEMNEEIADVLTSSQKTALTKLRGSSSKTKTVSSSKTVKDKDEEGSTKSTKSKSSKGKTSSKKK